MQLLINAKTKCKKYNELSIIKKAQSILTLRFFYNTLKYFKKKYSFLHEFAKENSIPK